MGHRGRAGRMRSWSAWSDAAGRANGAEAVAPGARSAGPTAGAPGVPPSTAVGAKVMPGTYNPYGGNGAQRAWRRYSTHHRRAVRLAGPVPPAGPPAANGPRGPMAYRHCAPG